MASGSSDSLVSEKDLSGEVMGRLSTICLRLTELLARFGSIKAGAAGTDPAKDSLGSGIWADTRTGPV